jgi:hypothetical protein
MTIKSSMQRMTIKIAIHHPDFVSDLRMLAYA